jgi:hypothetical protein
MVMTLCMPSCLSARDNMMPGYQVLRSTVEPDTTFVHVVLDPGYWCISALATRFSQISMS